jgi:hypothetical protein
MITPEPALWNGRSRGCDAFGRGVEEATEEGIVEQRVAFAALLDRAAGADVHHGGRDPLDHRSERGHRRTGQAAQLAGKAEGTLAGAAVWAGSGACTEQAARPSIKRAVVFIGGVMLGQVQSFERRF